MYIKSTCNVPVILGEFQCHLHYLGRFFKKPQIWYFTKIRPVGAEFIHEDGRADGRTD